MSNITGKASVSDCFHQICVWLLAWHEPFCHAWSDHRHISPNIPLLTNHKTYADLEPTTGKKSSKK